jgi:hypothetical protein
MPRRCQAAFEHVVATLAFDITQDPGDSYDAVATQVLSMLSFAAANGQEEARRILGWLQAVLRPNAAPAVPTSQEADWLATGMTGGSRVSGRRLRQLDPERYRATLRVLRRDYGGIGSEKWRLTRLGLGINGVASNELWYTDPTRRDSTGQLEPTPA